MAFAGYALTLAGPHIRQPLLRFDDS